MELAEDYIPSALVPLGGQIALWTSSRYTHHILEDHFKATILEVPWLICKEKTGKSYSVTTPLLDALQGYFGPAGALRQCDFETLRNYSSLVYQWYMCSRAYDATNANLRILKMILLGKKQPNAKKPCRQTGNNKAAAVETCNLVNGDQCLTNNIGFLQCMFWYLELCASIAEGDIGCAFEVVKVIMNNYLIDTSGHPGHWFELDLMQEHFNFWIK
ncbi:hypothetical protein ARMGADRAFT_1034120 [Armillaria gallica]|uniref:DUF6589 domain-containing protein n=1 Tax=Armillaria gallica TaxID=47427 RepID=A0A2H3D9Q0_ARMGA|nr:hypothetical protein ARMGADRAFT_1034120 [Armillaria gallica]